MANKYAKKYKGVYLIDTDEKREISGFIDYHVPLKENIPFIKPHCLSLFPPPTRQRLTIFDCVGR